MSGQVEVYLNKYSLIFISMGEWLFLIGQNCVPGHTYNVNMFWSMNQQRIEL